MTAPYLVLSVEVSELAFKSSVHLQCIQYHLVDMTLHAPKLNTTFEGNFGTLN